MKRTAGDGEQRRVYTRWWSCTSCITSSLPFLLIFFFSFFSLFLVLKSVALTSYFLGSFSSCFHLRKTRGFLSSNIFSLSLLSSILLYSLPYFTSFLDFPLFFHFLGLQSQRRSNKRFLKLAFIHSWERTKYCLLSILFRVHFKSPFDSSSSLTKTKMHFDGF